MRKPAVLVLALVGTMVGALGCARSGRIEPAVVASGAPAQAPAATVTAATTGAVATGAVSTAGASAAAALVSKCEGVSIELRNPHVDQGMVVVDAYLKNKAKVGYALMATGDGSSDGRRNPTLLFALNTPDLKRSAMCGFMNPLEEADFITLAPGSERKLEWVYMPQPAHPGSYTLRATYTNNPDAPVREKIKAPGMDARVKKTVACEVTSAPITVTLP